jgi:hypothetical protein
MIAEAKELLDVNEVIKEKDALVQEGRDVTDAMRKTATDINKDPAAFAGKAAGGLLAGLTAGGAGDSSDDTDTSDDDDKDSSSKDSDDDGDQKSEGAGSQKGDDAGDDL